MGRPCTICIHPERMAIDEALETDRALRDVAAQFGLSKASLHRHWQAHVPEVRALQVTTTSEAPAATALTTKAGFWSRVKTIAKWTIAFGICIGYGWFAATTPQSTPGAQKAGGASRLGASNSGTP